MDLVYILQESFDYFSFNYYKQNDEDNLRKRISTYRYVMTWTDVYHPNFDPFWSLLH